MLLVPQDGIVCSRGLTMRHNPIPSLPLRNLPRRLQKQDARAPRVPALGVEVAMALGVPKDVTDVRLTTTVSTSRHPEGRQPFTPRGASLLLLRMVTRRLRRKRQMRRQRTLPMRAVRWFRAGIAGLLLHRCGVGTSKATPSATRVVSCWAISRLFLGSRKTGLYYKLHGCYRPTTMKKSVIKRRKRVVPALRDQSPTAATHSSHGSSASPEASPAAFAHGPEDHYRYMSNEPSEHYQMMPGRGATEDAPRPMSFAPPPVDFTGYNNGYPPPPMLLQPERLGHSPVPQYGRRSASPNPIGIPKKRTLAETAAEALPVPNTLESGSNQLPPIMPSVNPPPLGRLSSISSILNHTDAARDDPPVDPTMGLQPPHHHSVSPAPHPPQSLASIAPLGDYQSQADRRARLQREAEEMREALRAKERELAEMGR